MFGGHLIVKAEEIGTGVRQSVAAALNSMCDLRSSAPCWPRFLQSGLFWRLSWSWLWRLSESSPFSCPPPNASTDGLINQQMKLIHPGWIVQASVILPLLLPARNRLITTPRTATQAGVWTAEALPLVASIAAAGTITSPLFRLKFG